MNRQPNDSLARFPLVFLTVAFFCIAPVACRTLCGRTVSLNNLVYGAMKAYWVVFNVGSVPPDLPPKIAAAHRSYWQADKAAHKAYASGDKATYDAAFEIAKLAGTDLIQMIIPLLYSDDAIALRTQLPLVNSL